MAINGRFKVSFGDVFPHGAYVVGEVEPVRDFEKSTRERPVQATDRETGALVWSVSVLDPDPDARKDAKTVTVKLLAPHQPVPPEAMAGMPFRPVEFDGMTVTPYLNENGGRPRVAYSLRATGMRAPSVGAGKPSPRGGQEAA
jgi:hypothetical protein